MALNQEQIAAAAHRGGHALVLAGPGTGKTSTLVARHAFLRTKLNVDPAGIVAITFTQKAAEEIKNRIGTNAPPRAWIGTFHGICLNLLKRFNIEADLAKNFKVIDPSAQKKLFSEMDIDWDQDDGDLGDIIGRWKDALKSPQEAAAEAAARNNVVLRKAAAHFEAYEEELQRRGHLDFSDLMLRATKLVREGQKASAFVKDRLPHILVDEFQDVNRAQVEFLLAMVQAGAIVWAVADDDQAIYGWRGGRVEYTVNFASYFPGAKQYYLLTNYRCDPAIIAAANAVIRHNKVRVQKHLKPIKEHKPNFIVRVRAFKSDKDEAEWIAASLAQLLERGAPAHEIGVLFRTSGTTAQLQQALERKRVPFVLSGTPSFWEMPEMTAMSDLMLAVERGDVTKGYRVKGGRDIVETMKGSSPRLTAQSVARLVADQPPAGLSSERQATWMDACYAIADLAKDFDSAAKFQEHVSEMGTRAQQDAGGVAITTIHSSKGLEWKQVFIIGCEAASMPHQRNEDIEEERRLFYVALTRSKGAVDLSFAKQRYGRTQAASPFLSELATAPKGAVRFVGDEIEGGANLQTKPTKAVQTAPQVANAPAGAAKVYILKDGRRSLIPPDER